MTRTKATLIHLGISLLVFFVIAWLLVEVWYPSFFYAIDGGWEGMRIIIGVDLVLGPLLTLIVFKPGKPGLKFDMTLICLFQSVCLAAGVWIVHHERPLYFVYYETHFYSVNAGTFEDYGLRPPATGAIKTT